MAWLTIFQIHEVNLYVILARQTQLCHIWIWEDKEVQREEKVAAYSQHCSSQSWRDTHAKMTYMQRDCITLLIYHKWWMAVEVGNQWWIREGDGLGVAIYVVNKYRSTIYNILYKYKASALDLNVDLFKNLSASHILTWVNSKIKEKGITQKLDSHHDVQNTF